MSQQHPQTRWTRGTRADQAREPIAATRRHRRQIRSPGQYETGSRRRHRYRHHPGCFHRLLSPIRHQTMVPSSGSKRRLCLFIIQHNTQERERERAKQHISRPKTAKYIALLRSSGWSMSNTGHNRPLLGFAVANEKRCRPFWSLGCLLEPIS